MILMASQYDYVELARDVKSPGEESDSGSSLNRESGVSHPKMEMNHDSEGMHHALHHAL